MSVDLQIRISSGNAAFGDGNAEYEVARILDTIKDRILQGQTSGKCIDYNGNGVGDWSIEIIED